MSILQQFNSDGGFVTTGNVNAANVVATHLFGDGANITGITATANTGNVTFSDQAVVGTGDGFGGSGLYLAPGPDSITGNLQYFRVRGGDVATHIHFDTGNNAYYDQFFGDDNKYVQLSNTGNIVVRSYQDGGPSGLWTFDYAGNLTLPGNTFAVNYANGDPVSISGGGGSANTIYNGTSNVTIPDTNGNIYFNTTDGVGNNWQWVMDINGNLVLPPNNNKSSITTATGTNNSITIHPDGTGRVNIKGDATPMLTVYSDTENNSMQMVIQAFGNSLGSGGGGTYVGQYLRPGTPLIAGDRLAALSGKGSYDGVNYISSAAGRVQIMAANTWSSTSTPTYVSIFNTPEGSTAQVENMRINPNGNVNINNGNIISQGAYITGNSDTGSNAFYAGVPGFTQLISNVVAQFTSNVNSYGQINFQNISSGSAASTDFILETDNSTEYTHFFDIGITSSTWDGSQTNSLGTALAPNDGYMWNQDGNIKIATTVGNAAPSLWKFDTVGTLTLASTNVSGGTGESALLVGTRRVVNGLNSGAQYAYSATLAAGGTPTVAYTATNTNVESVKVTFAVQSSGAGFQWEQFDVVAVQSQDTPGQVNFVVSNRVKAAAGIGDTQVTAVLNGSNQIQISLNLDAAQTSGGTSSFDAVEFGLMVD
jgi:hypothetical protein